MKKLLLNDILVIGLLLFFLNLASIAQPPPPPAAPAGSVSVKKWEPPSISTLKPDDVYQSWEGRFSIRLASRMISGYSAMTPESAGAPRSGGSYNWRAKEGEFLIQYFDDLEEKLAKNSPQELEQVLSYTLNNGIQKVKGTDRDERSVKLGSVPGRKAKFKIPSGATMFARNFIEGNRVFLLIGQVTASEKEAEKLVENVLDSFRILSQAEIDAEIARAIKDGTPEPLPQSPVAAKERSDAEDDNLKGKVKTVVEEDHDLSGTWQSQVRHRSSMEIFNELGDLVERISFDSTGHPFEVTVYGYIDGARVSKSKTLKGGTGFTITAAGPRDAKPRDPRYGYKRLYKYSAGRLSEMKLIMNDGDLWMTYAYEYQGDVKTQLVYSQNGKLNQKYGYKLDSKGNPIEYFRYDAFKDPEKIDRSYRYRYDSFDSQGNWTKRTRFEMVKERSVELEVPNLIEYRTISYYP